jgi:twitching motility protein PilT
MMARLMGDDCAADGAFTDPVSLEEGGFGRIRIRASKARNGLVLAIRFLCDYPPLFDELYLPRHIGDWMRQQGGLILFSGLTGSGKTTALGSCVRLALENDMKARILTFEDPIEYIFDHKLVSQYEIGVNTPTYIEGLRGVMRGDADIVVVQEFRDGPAIEAGLHAAEQGNLVLGTIHAASPTMVPDRIVAEFPPGKKDVIRAQLAGTLLGIVGLDLVRTKLGTSRRAAFEVMDFNQRPQMRNQILNGHPASQLRNEMTAGGLSSGCITKEQSLSTLVREGVITRDSAYKHSSPLYHEEIK